MYPKPYDLQASRNPETWTPKPPKRNETLDLAPTPHEQDRVLSELQGCWKNYLVPPTILGSLISVWYIFFMYKLRIGVSRALQCCVGFCGGCIFGTGTGSIRTLSQEAWRDSATCWTVGHHCCYSCFGFRVEQTSLRDEPRRLSLPLLLSEVWTLTHSIGGCTFSWGVRNIPPKPWGPGHERFCFMASPRLILLLSWLASVLLVFSPWPVQ